MKRILNNILISPWNFAYEMGRNYLSGGGGGLSFINHRLLSQLTYVVKVILSLPKIKNNILKSKSETPCI